MFAKIAGSVKKLFRDDGRFELNVAALVKHSFATRTGNIRIEARNVVESFARGVQACVSAPEQCPHIRRNKSVGEAVENGFFSNVAQIKCAGCVQVDNPVLAEKGTDSGLPTIRHSEFYFLK